jgi:predicted RNA-binding Zn-ribbon protein involved in translation (DUF1610 family)
MRSVSFIAQIHHRPRLATPLEIEAKLQALCPGCGRQMILSRVISWTGGQQSLVYECDQCWIVVTEPSIPVITSSPPEFDGGG